MASDTNRKTCESLTFEPVTPHFFKIILQGAIHDGRLGIPRKFVRKYGNDLSDKVHLKVPTGAVWQVELRKCGGDVWLQNGWQEFSKCYSVAIGHFLVFEYEGNCNFRVLIFDNSATEIEYPLHRTDGEKPNNNGELSRRESKMKENADDVSFKIRGNQEPCEESREKPPTPCPRPVKVMKTDPPNGTCCRPSKLCTSIPNNRTQTDKTNLEISKKNASSNPSVTELDEEDLFSRSREGIKPRGLKFPGASFTGREKRLAGYEKAKVLHRARAFKSMNPFFKLVMQPSYVDSSRHAKVAVPMSFVRKYFDKKKHADVKLYNAEGRNWFAKYHYGGTAFIYNGWNEFSQDNNLKVGDVCVFELISRTKIIFKVSIFRLQPKLPLAFDDGRRDNEDAPTTHIDGDRARGDVSSKSIPRTKFSSTSFQAPKIAENDDDDDAILVEISDDSSLRNKRK